MTTSTILETLAAWTKRRELGGSRGRHGRLGSSVCVRKIFIVGIQQTPYQSYQWIILLLVMGGRDSITPQKARTIPGI